MIDAYRYNIVDAGTTRSRGNHAALAAWAACRQCVAIVSKSLGYSLEDNPLALSALLPEEFHRQVPLPVLVTTI